MTSSFDEHNQWNGAQLSGVKIKTPIFFPQQRHNNHGLWNDNHHQIFQSPISNARLCGKRALGDLENPPFPSPPLLVFLTPLAEIIINIPIILMILFVIPRPPSRVKKVCIEKFYTACRVFIELPASQKFPRGEKSKSLQRVQLEKI